MTFVAILTNNLRIALIEMIPVIGGIIFFVSIFTTGQVLQALAIYQGVSAPLLGGSLFLLPFSVVELSSYAVATWSGTNLLLAWRRGTLHKEVRVFGLEIVVVAVMLTTAAAMETTALVSLGMGLALWLPLVGFILLLIIQTQKRRYSRISQQTVYPTTTTPP
jgi:hypothetical protein